MTNDLASKLEAEALADFARWGYRGGNPPGRKALPLSERKTLAGAMLNPAERAQAAALGGGNVSKGLRRALQLVRLQEAASLQAIADAAAQRDQTALSQLGQATSAFDD